jgi:hypothetical protein
MKAFRGMELCFRHGKEGRNVLDQGWGEGSSGITKCQRRRRNVKGHDWNGRCGREHRIR